MDEGTPLLAVSAMKMEHSNAAKRRESAGTFLLVFIASIFFVLQFGQPIPSAIGLASHRCSTSVVSPPPPCCHSGSQEGRRATEGDGDLASQCIPCPSSSSGAGSSSSSSSAGSSSSKAAASSLFAVNLCLDGQRLRITATKGFLGTQPPKWPIPSVSGLYFTTIEDKGEGEAEDEGEASAPADGSSLMCVWWVNLSHLHAGSILPRSTNTRHKKSASLARTAEAAARQRRQRYDDG